MSTELGLATVFLTCTINPYWHDYEALKRKVDTFADSLIMTIVRKARLRALMKFLKSREILGNIRGSVW
jgi:hypothetical protein